MRKGQATGAHAAEHERVVVIALIDYGAGNLTSVRKALAAIGAEVNVPRQPADLESAMGVIVPGVGNFQATAGMSHEWRDAILDVVGRGRPMLGICLGLQWLFEGSKEAPDCQGLGLMTGQCDRLERGIEPINAGSGQAWPLKIPHVGWSAPHGCSTASTKDLRCISLTRMPHRSRPTRSPSPLTGSRLRARSSGGRCSGCSFIRRNPATSGSAF
jgi:imidazole glycerol phosphate synthase glutamine amidotransferase subunit